MANDLRTAQPKEFFHQFLKENIRPDGRQLLEFRKTLLNLGSISTAEGSALVRLGNTMVVCGIKAELCQPTPAEPNKGFVVPNIQLPPVCSAEFRPGPPSEKAQIISQFIADTINNSKILALEHLCIEQDKLCWVLYADIVCVCHDGNIVDAALLALMAAMENTLLPKVTIDPETGVGQASSTEKEHLAISNRPVSCTIALFENSILLVDPTHKEEELAEGSVTIVVGSSNELCYVYKPGGCSLTDDILQNCILAAMQRATEVRALIDETHEHVDR